MSSMGKHPSSLNFSEIWGVVRAFPKYFQVYVSPFVVPSTFTELLLLNVVTSDLFITRASSPLQAHFSSMILLDELVVSIIANGLSVSDT